jgi:hypothetical protein
MARARLESSGRYRAGRSRLAKGAGTLIVEQQSAQPAHASLLLGFDFPIGLPRAYAARAGVKDFKAFLSDVASGSWPYFFEVAESADEIDISRPFYPMRPGGCSQDHLVRGLGA